MPHDSDNPDDHCKIGGKEDDVGRTEEALRESEERYRALVEQSPVGLIIYQEGRIVFANQAYCELTGYASEELLAMTPQQVLDLIHPEDREIVATRSRDRLEGKPARPRYEARLCTRGRGIRWIAICSATIFFHGRPAIQTTVMDITDRRQMEEQLAASERYLRSLIENATDVILVVNREGAHRWVSPAIERVTGYSPEQFLDIRPEDLVSPDFAERIRDSNQRMLADPSSRIKISGELRHRDGTWRRVESIGSTLLEDGEVAGFIINMRDVTDRWAAETRSAQSQKMEAIGRLAGGISHDFNNVLTVILAECDVALRRLSGQRPVDRQLGEIRAAAERAASLTRQLLAFSRRQFVEPTDFELSDAVGSMETMLRRLIGEDVDLVCRLSADAGAVRADRSQIEQVLLNLVINARDAMPRGGSLRIETARRGDDAVLAVEDSGVGIEDRVRARLFEPFFTTKEDEGTGLGLATSYGIVKRFGGHITVASRLGAGARFEVHLPCVAHVAPDKQKDRGEDLPTGTETILLVEDERPIRRVAAETLREQGYTVLEAGGADEAFARLEEHERSPNLLLTDLVLPGMNGRELADRIRKRHPGMRVLLMSGHSEELRRITPDRFYSMLLKPFSLATLTKRVRRALDRKS